MCTLPQYFTFYMYTYLSSINKTYHVMCVLYCYNYCIIECILYYVRVSAIHVNVRIIITFCTHYTGTCIYLPLNKKVILKLYVYINVYHISVYTKEHNIHVTIFYCINTCKCVLSIIILSYEMHLNIMVYTAILCATFNTMFDQYESTKYCITLLFNVWSNYVYRYYYIEPYFNHSRSVTSYYMYLHLYVMQLFYAYWRPISGNIIRAATCIMWRII